MALEKLNKSVFLWEEKWDLSSITNLELLWALKWVKKENHLIWILEPISSYKSICYF